MFRKLRQLIVFAALLWVIGFFAYLHYIRSMEPYDGKAEGIVVLTGGDGRVQAGLKLLSEGRAERLLISGVHRDVKVSELLTMNHQPQEMASKIDLGFAAQDTLGNAEETASWVSRHKVQSMIIVTANYHMPRALMHLGDRMPEIALYPYPVMPREFRNAHWYENKALRRLIIDDYNKFLLTYPQILFLKEDRP